ncbi:hypothetical protein ABTF76_20340, partial [Acinetobacter baumannii]
MMQRTTAIIWVCLSSIPIGFAPSIELKRITPILMSHYVDPKVFRELQDSEVLPAPSGVRLKI